MIKNILFLLAVILFMSCKNEGSTTKSDNWSNAQWISLEQLPDSMQVVPGVHGFGNHLGEKGLKRTVVPMFRKDFTIKDSIC